MAWFHYLSQLGNLISNLTKSKINYNKNRKDKINKDSLILLKNAGISFAKFKKDGIDPEVFSEFMNSSGNI